MTELLRFVDTLNSWIWGPPLLVLLVAAGLYLTYITKGIQFRTLGYSLKLAFTRHDDNAQGDISHFQALMTALAATIGIGSIAGVATAIATGGYGALFWMWIAGLIGMATKYAEGLMAIKYRIVDEEGQMCGGPMEYLERGAKAKWLAILFSFFGMLAAVGTGNMVQANSVSLALTELVPISPYLIGLTLMLATGVALFGGIKSIGKVAGVLVPVMAGFYILCGLIVIFAKITFVPEALGLIVKNAFTPQAASGGFLGSTVMLAIQFGISRGVFSSEAGLGTSPIAAAAAKTDTPGRQALISMSSVFITTVIVCTITGLAIALSGMLGQTGADGEVLNGAALALKSFDAIIPYGGLLVTIAIVPFAYSTILAWAYYGEKCVEYLFGIKAIKPYRVIYTLLVFPGAFLSLNLVWSLANLLNGLMVFPNLIGLFLLSRVISKETKTFEHILKKERSSSSP